MDMGRLVRATDAEPFSALRVRMKVSSAIHSCAHVLHAAQVPASKTTDKHSESRNGTVLYVFVMIVVLPTNNAGNNRMEQIACVLHVRYRHEEK
jgi:hypothetical protein